MQSGPATYSEDCFDFVSIMEEHRSRKMFKKYVDTVCYCPEIFSFIDAVEHYDMLVDVEEKKDAAQKIIEKYIENGSEMEVNICAKDRMEVLKTKEFSAAYESVLNSLKSDIFPRLCSSQIMKRHVAALPSKTVKKIVSKSMRKKLRLTLVLDTTNPSGSVNRIDIVGTKTVCSSGMYAWTELKSEEDYSAFATREKIEIQNICKQGVVIYDTQPFYRVNGRLNFKINDVLNMLANKHYRNIWDNSLCNSTQLAYFANQSTIDPYPSTITIENYPLPWPLTNRDFVMGSTMFKCPELEDTYYIFRKSTDFEKAPVRKGMVRAFAIDAWIISKVDENTTKYTNLFYRNMIESDALNNKLLMFSHLLNKKKACSLHSGIIAAMKQYQQDGFPSELSSSNGLFHTMQDREIAVNQAPIVMRTLPDGRPDVDAEQLNILRHYWETSDQGTSEGTDVGPLKRLTYVSKFSGPLSRAELIKIGEISIINNKFKNVSGILLSAEDVFYQVLEGLPQAVDETMEKILKDKRHVNIKIVKEEFDVKEMERQFPMWSMRTIDLKDHAEQYFAQHLLKLVQTVGDCQTAQMTEESTILQLVQHVEDIEGVEEKCEDGMFEERMNEWSEWKREGVTSQ
ncbi:photoactivated adenylate cyclase subunit alpha [Acrasis kona]|uniref:Photoactivated adenylate cyclase subunit alpha n=1 Tax=Acrasis kona TaxID=1008807 RepID=A0AAW2YW50_9EUKA